MPVLNKSNRIILHFKDTTGLFTALARILIDRGHDIEFIDREFGIIRTRLSPIPGDNSFDEQMMLKTVFRDSTITISSALRSVAFNREANYEVKFTKKRKDSIDLTWDELMQIVELLKPASITYSTVRNNIPNTAGYVKPPK